MSGDLFEDADYAKAIDPYIQSLIAMRTVDAGLNSQR
jgi:hypothetical protein